MSLRFTERPLPIPEFEAEVPDRDLKNRGHRRDLISGRMMLVGGEGEVLEQARTCAHPCVDELLPEMAGEGLPTCTGDLQRRTWRQAAFGRVLWTRRAIGLLVSITA